MVGLITEIEKVTYKEL